MLTHIHTKKLTLGYLKTTLDNKRTTESILIFNLKLFCRPIVIKQCGTGMKQDMINVIELKSHM